MRLATLGYTWYAMEQSALFRYDSHLNTQNHVRALFPYLPQPVEEHIDTLCRRMPADNLEKKLSKIAERCYIYNRPKLTTTT
ncbi:hypothetical protein GJV44_00848 [Candidatus Vallotia cooleyia]|nr:hypothetical protein GJV44_00848 [Candidatus Vallotia cooleyia]